MADTRAATTVDEGTGRKLEAVGGYLLRYGLVAILLWVGLLKFTSYEAMAIQPLVSNSPLLSWSYSIFSVPMFSVLLGVFEILLALLIAARPVAPTLSAVGSFGAILLFLVTLTFVFSTPGVFEVGFGVPFLSMLGQFLAKDVALVAIAVWTAGEALQGTRRKAS